MGKHPKEPSERKAEIMSTVLWLACVVSGFVFPFALLRAIRTKDESTELPAACVTWA